MNRLSAIARKSSLPKRTEKPFAAAYCSAAIAASMLAVSACCRGDAAACPFGGFGAPSPLVWPFTGGVFENGRSSALFSFLTCHSMNRRCPPSFRLADGERFAGLDAELDQLGSDHRRNVHDAFV